MVSGGVAWGQASLAMRTAAPPSHGCESLAAPCRHAVLVDRDVFEDALNNMPGSGIASLKFAQPGRERQDSVHSGFQVSGLVPSITQVQSAACPDG